MRDLDLSAIGDVVHASCNQKFYGVLLQGIQKEAKEMNISFSQKRSNIVFNDLDEQIKKRLEIALTCSRIRYLQPKLGFNSAVSFVLDDIDNGYSENLLSEIFTVIASENLYIHHDSNYILNPSFEIESFTIEKLNQLHLYEA